MFLLFYLVVLVRSEGGERATITTTVAYIKVASS